MGMTSREFALEERAGIARRAGPAYWVYAGFFTQLIHHPDEVTLLP
jgi:hypothetical protein